MAKRKGSLDFNQGRDAVVSLRARGPLRDSQRPLA